MKTAKRKPIFGRRIFWDVDFDAIGYNTKYCFVVERVFERGDVEDIRQCGIYYGDEKITHVLHNANFLPEHSVYLSAAVIKRHIEIFRYYKLRRLNPELCRY